MKYIIVIVSAILALLLIECGDDVDHTEETGSGDEDVDHYEQKPAYTTVDACGYCWELSDMFCTSVAQCWRSKGYGNEPEAKLRVICIEGFGEAIGCVPAFGAIEAELFLVTDCITELSELANSSCEVLLAPLKIPEPCAWIMDTWRQAEGWQGKAKDCY